VRFTKVGTVGDFPDETGRRVRVGDRQVAVFRIGDCWFAVQDACPHMGASLADGRIEPRRVVCRWHGHAFDLTTGRSDRRSAACAKVYPVRVEGDDVLVGDPPPAKAAPPADPEEEWIPWDPDRFFKK
jgi:nitrite reductase (NADH) small subunit